VRVAGDTYQWLYVWEGCVRAYKDAIDGVPGAVVGVGVEVTEAGNLDDVVYFYADGKPTRYAQVKYAADAATPVWEAYLFKPSANGGPSILQKITRSWQTLTKNGEKVQLALLASSNGRGPSPRTGHPLAHAGAGPVRRRRKSSISPQLAACCHFAKLRTETHSHARVTDG
jgi:hypothetical protein